ncbi:MAG: hypothetical protein AB2637_12150, partial [Candidatus Thiodiazotropha sp.]
NANERKYLKINVGCGLPHRPGLDLPHNQISVYPHSRLESNKQFAFITFNCGLFSSYERPD